MGLRAEGRCGFFSGRFRYVCLGYSTYNRLPPGREPGRTADMPYCVGLEMIEAKAIRQNGARAQVQGRVEQEQQRATAGEEQGRGVQAPPPFQPATQRRVEPMDAEPSPYEEFLERFGNSALKIVEHMGINARVIGWSLVRGVSALSGRWDGHD